MSYTAIRAVQNVQFVQNMVSQGSVKPQHTTMAMSEGQDTDTSL